MTDRENIVRDRNDKARKGKTLPNVGTKKSQDRERTTSNGSTIIVVKEK